MSKDLWTGSCRSRWATPMAVLLLALGLAGAVLSVFWSAALLISSSALVLSSAIVMLFRRIEMTIDRQELVVRFSAPWSWPMRIARKNIASVSIEPVSPLRWGGYGYRGSLHLFKKAAIVLRKGEALSLKLKNGRTLLITVDRTEEAVAVLDG